ncbi:MAG: translocation/assembly module TamB domain-containing protein [bacterium]
MRKIVIFSVLAVTLLFLVFFLAGTQLVLNFVKQKVESSVQTQLNVPVNIGSIKGNLFYSLEVTDVKIGKAVELNSLRTSYHLLKIMSKEIAVDHLDIDGLIVNVNRAESLIQNIAVRNGDNKKQDEQGFKLLIKDFSLVNSKILGHVSDREIDVFLEMEGMMQPQILIIDVLTMTTDNSFISCSGRVPLNDDEILDITYRLNLLLDEFNFNGVKGTVASSGNVTGQIAAPRFFNETELNVMYDDNNLSGKIAIVWQTPDLDNLALSARLDARTPPLQKNKKQQDEWHLTLDAQGRELQGEISSIYGRLRLTGSLTGDMENPEFDADFNGRFRFMHFRPHIQGNITYRNDTLLVKKCQLTNRELYATCDAAVLTTQPQKITADISVSCDDIGLVNAFLASPQPVSGKINIAAIAKGTLQEPFVTGTVELQGVEAFTERITDALFRVAFKDTTVYLNSGVVRSPRGVIELDGMFKIADSTFKLHVKSDEITLRSPGIFDRDTIPLSGDLSFDINLQGNALNPYGNGTLLLRNIVYDTLEFGDYDLTAAIKDSTINLYLLDNNMTLEVAAEVKIPEPFTFDAQLNLKHFDLREYTRATEAYITAGIAFQGKAVALADVNASVRIDTIFAALPQSVIHNVGNVNIAFEKGIIDIRTCVLDIHDQSIAISGQIPVDIKNGYVNINVVTSQIEIADLAAIIPDAPDIKGLLAADIGIKGSLRIPQISGQVSLEDISYSAPDIAVDSVNGYVVFHNNHIDIKQIKGRINRGFFNIDGYAEISKQGVKDASMILTAEKIDVSNKDYGSAIINSILRVSAKKDSVKITGEITLGRAVYDVPFNHQMIIKTLTQVNQPPPEQADFLKKVFCDVGVSAPKGVFIMNNIADIAADLDLQIKGYLSKVNVYGTIATSRKGTVKYLGKKFDITNAQIQFDNPYEINPVIDLNAVNYISSIDGDYEISLHVSGTVKEWRLELTSSPSLPEQDIVSLLVIGRRRPGMQVTKGGKGLDLKGTAKDYAVGVARTTIEKTAEQKLGIEKFTITGDLLNPRGLDIGIEKTFAKKFTLIYGTGLESWELRRIGMNYDLTDNLSIFTLHDQENMNSSVDLDFHFKLK